MSRSMRRTVLRETRERLLIFHRDIKQALESLGFDPLAVIYVEEALDKLIEEAGGTVAEKIVEGLEEFADELESGKGARVEGDGGNPN